MENVIKILFESEEGVKSVYVERCFARKEIEKKIMKILEEKIGKEDSIELIDSYQEAISSDDENYFYQIFEKGFMFGFKLADHIYNR